MVCLLLTFLLPGVMGLLGGEPVDTPVPYVVTVNHVNYGYLCGGAIISLNSALSVARCNNRYLETDLQVVVDVNNDFGEFKTYDVDSIIQREDFNGRRGENDISIIRIQGSFTFNDKVLPISLPQSSTGGGKNLMVTSYGSSDSFSSDKGKLKTLNFTSLSNDDCNKDLGDRKVAKGQLCAYPNKNDTGVCRSDIGSPLVGDNGRLVGLTLIVRCGGRYPTIFTDVFTYDEWIRNNTGIPMRRQ